METNTADGQRQHDNLYSIPHKLTCHLIVLMQIASCTTIHISKVYNLYLGSNNEMTSHIAKIVEIVGSSEKSWQDAAQAAVSEAKKTVRGIKGLEVQDMTAKVNPNTGDITQYRVCVKLAFGIEH